MSAYPPSPVVLPSISPALAHSCSFAVANCVSWQPSQGVSAAFLPVAANQEGFVGVFFFWLLHLGTVRRVGNAQYSEITQRKIMDTSGGPSGSKTLIVEMQI